MHTPYLPGTRPEARATRPDRRSVCHEDPQALRVAAQGQVVGGVWQSVLAVSHQ